MDNNNSIEQNNTNYPQTVKNSLSKLKYENEFLKYYQFVVTKYVEQNPGIRGLLLYFNVGFGKTILAISLSLLYKKLNPERQIIVLLSKGLIQNFKDNVKKFLDNHPEFKVIQGMNIEKEMDKYFKFISFRSNAMYKNIAKLKESDAQKIFDDQLGKTDLLIDNVDFLNNTILIVDEAHNFFNAITNGSANSLMLYNKIMKARRIKLFFLTGTPIVNDPFELVPCFNMLKGNIPVQSKHQKIQYIPLLPESRKEFYNYFVDTEKNDVKNKSRFQNRIIGLLSYYGELYEGKNPDFPEQLPTIIEKIPMSPFQFAEYDGAREIEKEEASFKRRTQQAEKFMSKSQSSSTYRIKSRQLSNFVFPEHAKGPKRGKKMQEKFINKLTDDDWENVAKLSPKLVKLMSNIKKNQNLPGLIYSEFVKGEGIAVIAKYLERNGYINLQKIDTTIDDANDVYSISTKKGGNDKKRESEQKKLVFAIITGELDIQERSAIVDMFNSSDNKHGAKIMLLLVNKIAAEGLDLKYIRHIHIFEPFWNYARIEQIIGRGVRYKSHADLPLEERKVQPYMYLCDYPDAKVLQKEQTTDVDMYNKLMENKHLNDKFKMAMIEASLDCNLHQMNPKTHTDKIKCKLCTPTNVPLYNAVIAKDLILPDPCTNITETKIMAKEIIDEETNTKYMYSANSAGNNIVYEFDNNVNGYVLMKPNNPLYVKIMSLINSVK